MNKSKYLLSILHFIIFVVIKAQNGDTVFIKKDQQQAIYILKNRNSPHYNSMKNFQEFEELENKNKNFGLASKWIQIYRYNESYLLYTPCDEINEVKYVISDDKIHIKSSEITSYNICKINRKGKNIIIKYKEPNSNKKTILIIMPIDQQKGIYKFVTNKIDGTKYDYTMVDIEKYKNFDVLVNECNNSKMSEFRFRN